MTEEKKEIIDAILLMDKSSQNSLLEGRNFETEHFVYWSSGKYIYDGKELTRDEFNVIKDYYCTHKTLPCYDSGDIPQIYSIEKFLRYSKTYDCIELYTTYCDFKTTKRSAGKIVIVTRNIKELKVTSKNYVLINRKRWLSLRNWQQASHATRFSEDLIFLLMKKMLGNKSWIDELPFRNIKIQNKNSRNANSLSEAVGLECGAVPAKFIMNMFKDDVNQVIELYQYIGHNNVNKIISFIKRHPNQIKTILERERGSSKVETLLYLYFLTKDNRLEKHLFMDYLFISKKVNLNISSYKTFKKKHDEHYEAERKKKLEKNSKNRKLKISKEFPKIKSNSVIEFEMIKDTSRLLNESTMLHHCVHSYESRINSGNNAIYSVLYKNLRYTLQVQKQDKGKEDEYLLKAVQLRGKYNCDPPIEMKSLFEKELEKNSIVLSENEITWKQTEEVLEAIKYRDDLAEKEAELIRKKEFEKENIKQIGERILYSENLFKSNSHVLCNW